VSGTVALTPPDFIRETYWTVAELAERLRLNSDARASSVVPDVALSGEWGVHSGLQFPRPSVELSHSPVAIFQGAVEEGT
jgi:hypothetical protein